MRRRNMYNATGLPGWMRLGYSPGWVGRSPGGVGPCAQFLMTGQWPNPAMAAAAQGVGPGFAAGPQATPEQQLTMLQAQANLLEQQLQAIRQQIADMEGE
jgi:hypothetical protein